MYNTENYDKMCGLENIFTEGIKNKSNFEDILNDPAFKIIYKV